MFPFKFASSIDRFRIDRVRFSVRYIFPAVKDIICGYMYELDHSFIGYPGQFGYGLAVEGECLIGLIFCFVDCGIGSTIDDESGRVFIQCPVDCILIPYIQLLQVGFKDLQRFIETGNPAYIASQLSFSARK